MNKPILLQEYLNKELNFDKVEIRYLLKKYSKSFLENGCESHSSVYLVVDKNKLNNFIQKERNRTENKAKPEIDNSSATPRQSEKLLNIRWAIKLKIEHNLTDTDFLVLSEFILITQHGFNNDLPVNQGEISKSIGISPSNIRKSITRLIDLDLLSKYKPENRTSLVNNFSLNLEKLTGLNCRKVIN